MITTDFDKYGKRFPMLEAWETKKRGGAFIEQSDKFESYASFRKYLEDVFGYEGFRIRKSPYQVMRPEDYIRGGGRYA